MGYWGGGSFENDFALDWLDDLATAPDLTLLRGALAAAVGASDGLLDASTGAEAIAAAEVVAALRGHPAVELPEEAGAWVRRHRHRPEATDGALQAVALRALERVGDVPERSELRRISDDGEPGARDAWHAAIADLRTRLSAPVAAPAPSEPRRWWEVWKGAS